MTVHRFAEQLADQAAQSPSAPALLFGDEVLDYRELSRQVAVMCTAFRELGIGHGDRVVIYMSNRVEAIVAIYAILAVGAVFVPLSPQLRTGKLAHILEDIDASLMITEMARRSVWQILAEQSARLPRGLVVDNDDGVSLPENWVGSRQSLQDISLQPDVVADDDLAAVIYTSGSSGDQKGIMLSHRNMQTAADAIIEYLGLGAADKILCALPLSFDYGLYQALMAFSLGATLVLERSFAFPAAVIEVLEKHRCTVLPGVPTMLRMLLENAALSQHDLSALRKITNTGAAMDLDLVADVRERFPAAQLYSMYGLTECKRVSYLAPEQLDARSGSVGRGMPHQELWIVDESGTRLAPGNSGELVVAGDHVMRGYWNRPQETDRVLQLDADTGRRTLRTGDLFRQDDDGYLYFLGRKDDMLKVRGEKVSPREIEQVLLAADSIVDAAVTGVEDALQGTRIYAWVVLALGTASSEQDIIRHCSMQLENHMVPSRVSFCDSFPLTSTGKTDKRALAARCEGENSD